MIDVRFYAITSWGRQLLEGAKTLAQARGIVASAPHLSDRIIRIVQETRREFPAE